MKKMFSRAASLLVTIYYWTPFLSFIGSGSACGPPTPPHGSVIKHPLNGDKLTHDNGSVVLFVCKQGFYLVGPPIIKCTGSSWTRINFRCLGFCPELRSIPNGRVVHVPTSAAGKTAVEFYCETNYRLIGRPRLECIDGRWNGSLPFCEELKSCKRLDTPANGTKHGASFNHGAQVDFSCLSGFDLFGSRKLTCRNGFWSASVPSCKAYCMEVRDPPNGRKHGIRFGHSQLVSFECNPGYELVGRSTLQCIDGKWNSTVPICKVMLCPDPLISKNAYVAHPVGNNVKYTHGTTIFLACREGHYLVGIPMMVCNTTFWSKMKFSCIVVNCGSLDEPSHGEIIESVGTTFGNRIVFRCNDIGYEIKGSAERTCQSDGSWSGSKTTCELVECGDPGTPENGKQIVSKGYVYGGSVKFVCDRDYTLRGKDTMYCQADKNWRGSVPECLAPCSDPGVPYQGGRIVGGLRHDQTVTFTCPRDYVMKGARTITCSNGRWSNEKPSCLACALSLGMADGRIADTQLSESSRVLGDDLPIFGRLNGYGGWCADTWSLVWKTSLLQVEFDRKTRITGIATQGKDPGSSWVTRYHLKYKDLDNEFTWYNGKKVFTGNSNTDEVVRNDLEESFVTRAVQVVPSEYHRWPCLRMELYGCEMDEDN